jgi:Flp pilus assembly pilin Flp
MRRQASGQALVEYVVLLAMGSLVAIGTVTIAGRQLSDAYDQVGAVLANPAAVIVPTASAAATPAPVVAAIATAAPAAASTPAPADPNTNPHADTHAEVHSHSHN